MTNLVRTGVGVLTALSLSACEGSKGAQCAIGAQGTKGDPGKAAVPCTAAGNGDGSYTVTCPGSEPIVVSDGMKGDRDRTAA